ncbi:hypothetical protein EMIHUDRAFT_195138 [Emiliania huxleyi CCMP1516]|uniref:Uncharacterized protein n=2 Tax=Emiliania huxleyi TaxID=2903 RepID=A0A0D3JGY9_EMIH1|nr:hypothetical protein EMIHUDRAFT_195138 [Emiliania huxleyi CCMP1516]EOD22774.1 hypothetical protein EMIHUDRAFT_195138 [Emiliania huxleyi CCMP1516]|eukprot:XP_005775203.1 hypothetical protein EMIHUDRAFT_195138 [Emiliania huxleyi CCMP1516]
MATSSASPLAPPPSPAGPPPLAIRDGAARDRDLGGDRLQNDTPPMLLGSPPLATRDGSAMQLGGGQLEMDEMDEEGRTRHHARMLNNGLALASQKVQTPDNLEMDEMDEEERTRHLRRLRKRGVDSNFPAPPPLEFSRRCNGTCRKDRTVPIMPGEPGRGRMHVFPSLPPRRIAGCLEGPELEAARAENGMLWTRPTSGRRCAAPATLQ